MSDNKETEDDKTIRSKPMTLNLKKTVDAGHVQQSVSRGRKNAVIVEKKKRRVITRPGTKPAAPETPPVSETPPPAPTETVAPAPKAAATPAAVVATPPAAPVVAAPTPPPTPKKAPPRRAAAPRPKRGGAQNARQGRSQSGAPSDKLSLSNKEMDARSRALAMARERAAADAEQRQIDEAARNERAKASALELERKTAEKVLKAEDEKNQTKLAEAEAKRAANKPANKVQPAKKASTKMDQAAVEAQAGKRGEFVPAKSAPQAKETLRDRRPTPTPTTRTKGGNQKRSRKLTIQNALDEGGRQRSLASLRRRQQKQRRANVATGPAEKIAREVILPEAITIQELANRMAERAVDVIKFLMKQGQMHQMNDVIDSDTAELIAEEFGHTVKRVSEADVEEGFIGQEDDAQDLRSRAPVVTIMGHVDHGKTSLLDAIREANVVSGEAGGITQHIGAYQVDKGEMGKISFIDTPGHAAFTEMRSRGAKVTDIVVLVVAANDGVMPQTIEAINHARDAGVPIIVAINKIDLPEADANRVRTDLLQHEIVVESMGGDVLEVEVSALKQTNLDGLLEAILNQSELLELKANPDRKAEGFVIEAQLERGRGSVATLLVQRGTLKVGNIVVAGPSWGRARALVNDQGDHIAEAGPAMPVEVLGLNSAPNAGDQFAVVESEQKAREITEYRERKRRDMLAGGTGARTSLEQMMSQLKEAGKQEFKLIIKGDVQGSIEAIIGALDKLGTEEVAARIVHSAVGGINESDITLASASNAIIVGFNVRANTQAKMASEAEGIEIRYYSVIYDLVDDVKAAMSGLLAPERREHFIGNAEILEIFNITKVGKIAGCRVTEGKMERGAGVRLIRDNVVIHEGELSTLKRFKDEVKEVPGGQECGMAFENYQDMRAGDVIEAFTVEMIDRNLD
ncbi:MAG: translation initiation factor IF-2 [Hyphomicrobiaceae bacterium]|nr:translation initiation factor IF-2 [Hyphomicrobiaceae bacterium]